MRTIVDIPEQDIRALDRCAKRERVSRAEMVRRAVRGFVSEQKTDPLERYFGLWKDRDDIGDGLTYQQALRDEWKHRA